MRNFLYSIILLVIPFYTNAQIGNWQYINDGNSCNAFGSVGSCSDGRHEASYVQLGDKFYLLGGRENNGRVNIYDPLTDVWTIGATPSIKLHHFQAVEYYGLMIIAGAMTGDFPNEPSVDKIMVYDPISNIFIDGPLLPINRVRGGAGCTIYNDEIYIVSGTTSGHRNGGHQTWVDKYNPETDIWTELADAPRARDHFQVSVIDNKLYAAAGRQSGASGTFNATIAELDQYDFTTNTWVDLQKNIPTERAGNTIAILNDELIVIGGEREAGNAKSEVEAFNPLTQTWRTLSPLLTGRHGTQAIVNNENIWLASGSPNRGGGFVKSQERFSFSSYNTPILNTIIKSDLTGVSNVKTKITKRDISDVLISGLNITKSKEIVLSNDNGNQAIVITDIQLSDDTHYSFSIDKNLPFIIKPESSFKININYSINSSFTPSSLIIRHTGNIGEKTIDLTSEFFSCNCTK